MGINSTIKVLAPNIYLTEKGIRARAKLGPHRKEKRFKTGTPLREINAWLEDTRRDFRKRRSIAKRQKGLLAGDVAAFLDTLPAGRARNNTATYLAAWMIALGECRRSSCTVDRLQAVVTKWINAGVAANTIKHRRRALAQLIEYCDGDDAPNAARALKVPREPDAEARGVDMQLLDAIIRGMDRDRSVRDGRGGKGFRNKSQARLLMMLWTGITPASLMRLKPHHVNLDTRTLTLPSRKKGRGAHGVTVPLFPQGVEACRAWLRAFAWGTFGQRSLRHAFRRAVRRYIAREADAGRTVTVPPDLRVYDLRHSFASWLWEVTADPLLVQHFLQHADLKTTARYTRGTIDARALAIVERAIKQAAIVAGSAEGKSA